MTVPLMILAGGAVLVGFLGLPAWLAHLPDFWSEWLHPVLAGIPGAEEHHHDAGSGFIAMGAGTAVGLGGIFYAWSKYYNKAWRPAEQLSPLHQFLMDKWRVDEFYAAVLIRPMTRIAMLAGNVDRIAVDGMTKLAAAAVSAAGFLFTRLQTGAVHAYGAAMALGLVVVSWWVLYPHPYISAAAEGDSVHFVAGAGLGYQYRWDFDSDGKFDTQWSPEQRDVNWAYDGSDLVGMELTLVNVIGRNRGSYKVRLGEGESADLDPSYLGDGWQTDPESREPPHVLVRGTELLVRPGASSLKVDGVPAQGAEIPVPVGASIQLGSTSELRVDPVVRSTLEVRNAFGSVASTETELAVQARAKREKTARTRGLKPPLSPSVMRNDDGAAYRLLRQDRPQLARGDCRFSPPSPCCSCRVSTTSSCAVFRCRRWCSSSSSRCTFCAVTLARPATSSRRATASSRATASPSTSASTASRCGSCC